MFKLRKHLLKNNVLCFYNGLPAEFIMDSLNNDCTQSPLSPTETDTMYDYSVYNNCQQMMDEEDVDNMVWIEY